MNDLPVFWYSCPDEVYLSPPHFLCGSHVDLGHNRPGSSWPDKLHSQRPFPSLGKKVCILFSPTTVTNTRRGAVRLSSLWTNPQTKNSSEKCLHSSPHVSLTFIFTTFYIHGSQHGIQVDSLRLFTTNNGVLEVLLEIKKKNISINVISWFHSNLNSLQLSAFCATLVRSADPK